MTHKMLKGSEIECGMLITVITKDDALNQIEIESGVVQSKEALSPNTTKFVTYNEQLDLRNEFTFPNDYMDFFTRDDRFLMVIKGLPY